MGVTIFFTISPWDSDLCFSSKEGQTNSFSFYVVLIRVVISATRLLKITTLNITAGPVERASVMAVLPRRVQCLSEAGDQHQCVCVTTAMKTGASS